jgi:hypothetical protein
MGDAETIEPGKEALGIFEPCDHAFLVAEEGPALGDAREKLRAILEARAIDETEER